MSYSLTEADKLFAGCSERNFYDPLFDYLTENDVPFYGRLDSIFTHVLAETVVEYELSFTAYLPSAALGVLHEALLPKKGKSLLFGSHREGEKVEMLDWHSAKVSSFVPCRNRGCMARASLYWRHQLVWLDEDPVGRYAPLPRPVMYVK